MGNQASSAWSAITGDGPVCTARTYGVAAYGGTAHFIYRFRSHSDRREKGTSYTMYNIDCWYNNLATSLKQYKTIHK